MKKTKYSHSLFFHLLLTMVFTASLIIVSVTIYYRHTEKREHPVKKHIIEYTNLLTESLGHPPQFEKAEEISERLSIDTSFTGANATWKTKYDLPDISEFRKNVYDNKSGTGKLADLFFRIVETEDGILVFTIPHSSVKPAGLPGFLFLLSILGIIFVLAWWMMRRHLRPVLLLDAAFEKVSQGNFSERLEIKRPREFQKASEGFNQMVKKIAQMMELRENLLRDISHELKSPLTRINLALQFIEESAEKKSIKEDLDIMHGMLRELLDSSRYDQAPEMKDVNPAEILQDVARTIKKLWPDFVMDSNLQQDISIRGNADNLFRAFYNLLDNAIKYGKPPVKITLQKKEGNVMIEIEDAGNGISDANREKIFEPMFQEDPARTPGSGGYGLGLYIVKKIIQQHNGKITAAGSHFSITIPL